MSKKGATEELHPLMAGPHAHMTYRNDQIYRSIKFEQNKGYIGVNLGYNLEELIERLEEFRGRLEDPSVSISPSGTITLSGWEDMTEEELAAREQYRENHRKYKEDYERKRIEERYERYLKLKEEFEPDD